MYITASASILLLILVLLTAVSMELTEPAVEVRGGCMSVAQSGDETFIGMSSSGVDVIRAGKSCSLITLPGNVNSIAEHNNRLYLLYRYKFKWTVEVYGVDGSSIRSWKHEDAIGRYNKLFIYNDIVLIPSRSQNSITTYTLTGSPAGRNINVNLSHTRTSVCVTTSGHVVVSQCLPSLVVCVDFNTGTPLWNISCLDYPGALVSDRCGRILVYIGGMGNTVQVEVLRVKKGE